MISPVLRLKQQEQNKIKYKNDVNYKYIFLGIEPT